MVSIFFPGFQQTVYCNETQLRLRSDDSRWQNRGRSLTNTSSTSWTSCTISICTVQSELWIRCER
jgi:hypothetical protein